MAEKKSKRIVKRLSKSERTHNRRVKQEARNDSVQSLVKK